MIQRIQTVWLSFAAICAVLTYRFPFYSGNKLPLDPTGKQNTLVASSNFLILVFTAGLIAGTIAIIFMYKNRKQQMWLVAAAVLLSVINLILYFNEIKKFTSGEMSLGSVFSFAIPIFLLLAIYGIRKDEKLIKSLDRLR
jgi:drug/metabolite transporter (DMT)-like permease